ncbi:MAG TPA: hypothetical protein VJZ02_01220 [Candidatus Brocadiales bacterium]|nr:hypothetical protein [Candidatus Brocadiales bacterium]
MNCPYLYSGALGRLGPGAPEKPSVLKVIDGTEGVEGSLGTVNRDVSCPLDGRPKGDIKVVLGLAVSGGVKVLGRMLV